MVAPAAGLAAGGGLVLGGVVITKKTALGAAALAGATAGVVALHDYVTSGNAALDYQLAKADATALYHAVQKWVETPERAGVPQDWTPRAPAQPVPGHPGTTAAPKGGFDVPTGTQLPSSQRPGRVTRMEADIIVIGGTVMAAESENQGGVRHEGIVYDHLGRAIGTRAGMKKGSGGSNSPSGGTGPNAEPVGAPEANAGGHTGVGGSGGYNF